jgi:hypothetical protein
MKKNSIIFIVALMLCCVAAFFTKKLLFIENDMNNYIMLNKLQDKTMVVENYSTQEDFSEEELKSFVATQCEAAMDSEYVLNVTPTGNLYINNSVLMQEVMVNRVIKGKCVYEKIWICSEGCTIEYGNDVYDLLGMDYSLMQLENQYIVFCIPSEINQYSDKKVYYTDDTLWFPYYNITSTHENVMEDEYYNKNIEFYTDSDTILKYYNQLKVNILKEFVTIQDLR